MLNGKDLLSIHDLSTDEVAEILDFAAELKTMQKAGVEHKLLAGKTLGMIFEKSSTRTRVSFEVGIFQLGGTGLFLSSKDLQLGRGEPIKDTARVLSRYLDGIMIRTFEHAKVEELAKFASIPVINGLTDLLHPCQVLTDLLTIREHKGKNFRALKMAYVGDGNNMTHSLLITGAILGSTVAAVCPKGDGPDAAIFNMAAEIAKKSGARLLVTGQVSDVKGYDIAYTDTWVSMGDNTPLDQVKARFMPYQVNQKLLDDTGIRHVLHCQPEHRGYAITDEVMDGPASIIYDEAENRLHAQMAVMATLFNQGK